MPKIVQMALAFIFYRSGNAPKNRSHRLSGLSNSVLNGVFLQATMIAELR